MAEQRDTRSTQTLLLDIWQRLARVEAQNDQIKEGQIESMVSRRLIHEKLESFVTVADTVKRMEPLVMDHEKSLQRGIGGGQVVGAVAKAVYAIIGAALATAGWLANAFLGGQIRH
jgi:hypothetical protein